MARKLKFNWGTGIFLTILLFIGGMATMVTYVQKNLDVQLVATDYYEQEIAYQEEILRRNRGLSAEEKPSVLIDTTGTGSILLNFPKPERVSDVLVKLIRLNDANMDFFVPALHGQQTPLNLPASGAWKIRITWKSSGEECVLPLGTKVFS